MIFPAEDSRRRQESRRFLITMIPNPTGTSALPSQGWNRNEPVSCHIDVGTQSPLEFYLAEGHFGLTPGSAFSCNAVSNQFAACLSSRGHRVVLSGIGGDEVTGGVPTPMPEFADLLARGQLKKLAHQLRIWALQKRQPWYLLLLEASKEFFPVGLFGIPKQRQPPTWLNPTFINGYRSALLGYESRLKLFGPLPSFQVNLNTVNALRRQLVCTALPSRPSYERRYPYLDRSLLEFLFSHFRGNGSCAPDSAAP